MAFHEHQFPTGISFGSRGGPTRRTTVRISASGAENRNSLWANSRRRYDVGYGIKTTDDLHNVLAFFEERRGRLHGFRFKDQHDFKSTTPSATVSHTNQDIGTGDGSSTTFQLKKKYGSLYAPYDRAINKPVNGTVFIGLDGANQASGWSVDITTGIVTFDTAPENAAVITAGFEFDVPVRFDTDELEIDYEAFEAGTAPSIPIVELLL